MTGPDSAWNPSAWVFGIARAVAFTIYPPAVVALLPSAVGLLHTRNLGDRRLFRLSAVTTPTWTEPAVLTIAPCGGLLLTRLLH